MANKLLRKGQFEHVIKEMWKKANEKFVKNITFDEGTRKFSKVLGNDQTNEINTKPLVTEWQDLEYTTKRDISTLNLANYDAKITGRWFGNSGTPNDPSPSDEHSMIYVDIIPNKEYTIFKKHNDGVNRIFFLTDDNVRVAEASYNANTVGSWTKYHVPTSHTSPNGNRKKITVQFKHGQNSKEDIMVFEGNITQEPQAFVSYTGKQILVDSREVSLSYSNDNGVLNSKTIHDAVEELSEKAVKQSTLDDYVHKDKDITLNGKVTLANGYITNTPISVQNPTTHLYEGWNADGMDENGYTIHEYTKAPKGVKVVKMVVGMADNTKVGETINNIKIGVKEDGTNNNVKEYFLQNYSTKVVENHIIDASRNERMYPINSEKVVVIPINQTYQYDAPFIISVPKMIWGNVTGGDFRNGKMSAGKPAPTAGQPIPNYGARQNFYIGRVVVYGEDLPIKDLVKQELSKDQNFGGKVTLVNGYIAGKNVLKINNTNATNTNTNEKFFFICDDLTGGVGGTNVTQVTIGVDSRIPEGTVLKGIKIGKSTLFDSSQYFITDRSYVMTNGSAVVYKNTNKDIASTKAITVDLRFTVSHNERVFVGVVGMVTGQSTSSYSFSGELPVQGQSITFPMTARNGQTGQVVLHTEEVPLSKVITNVSRTSGGTVGSFIFHRADGTQFSVQINGGATQPQPFKLSSRVGETRSFAYDISTIAVPKTFSTRTQDDDLEVEDDLPVISNKFPHITGTKIEMDGGVWVKATGQRLDNLISGKTITLPTSKEFEYIFVCLGAIDYEQEAQPSN